jgi:hypothetical protein
MRWPWQKDQDQREPSERDLDAEFQRTKSKIDKALTELREEVERAQFREAARERHEQHRRGPATA